MSLSSNRCTTLWLCVLFSFLSLRGNSFFILLLFKTRNACSFFLDKRNLSNDWLCFRFWYKDLSWLHGRRKQLLRILILKTETFVLRCQKQPTEPLKLITTSVVMAWMMEECEQMWGHFFYLLFVKQVETWNEWYLYLLYFLLDCIVFGDGIYFLSSTQQIYVKNLVLNICWNLEL